MENPIKIDDLGVPLFSETPKSTNFKMPSFPISFHPLSLALELQRPHVRQKKNPAKLGRGKHRGPWGNLWTTKQDPWWVDEWFIQNNIFIIFLKRWFVFALSKPKPWEWMCFFLEDFGAKRTKPWKLLHITDTGLSFLYPSKALILSGFSSWLLLNESVSTQESL